MNTKTKSLSTNKIFLPLLFILFSIIFEITNFLYLGFTNGNGDRIIFPAYFLYDLTIICMLAAVIFVVQGKKTMKAFFFIFLTIQFLLNIVNTTMYSIFGEILSWDLLKLGAEATTAITMDFIDWGGVFLNIGLFAVMITAVVLLYKYNKKTFQVKHFSFPVIALAILFFSMSINVCLFNVQTSLLKTSATAETEIESSDKYLWDNFQFKIEAYKKFGHFGFYTKSILNFIFTNAPEGDELQTYIDYIDEGHVDGDETAPLYNDNLIVILCESVDLFAMDPINTPTLWSMYQGENTIVFENFRARNRTNISEGITLLGSMPKNLFIENSYKAGYQFDYSLPNVFKRAGDENVLTTYMHANNKSYYSRNITHKADGVGFDQLLFIEEYTGEQHYKGFCDWITDLSFTQNLMDKILPTDQRFLTYFSTLSTHGPYTSENEYFAEYYELYDQNYEEFAKWQEENTDFIMPKTKAVQNMYRIYKAQMIDLDYTIRNLLNELELRGLQDNTSILLYADHNAYFHDLNYKIRGVEKEDFSNTYVNHIPCMLYSPKLIQDYGYENKVSNFCNTYDILPTLCDLYGMESNTNIYQGYSVFSSDIQNSLFASHLGGIFTDDIFSSNIADVYALSETVTDNDIARFKKNASKFYKKQEYLEKIYTYGINGTIR